MKLHIISNPREVIKNKELGHLLGKNKPPRPNVTYSQSLLQGTPYFVQITFNTPSGNILAISDGDLQTAINYSNNPITVISRYVTVW
jgi:hypothetical protein